MPNNFFINYIYDTVMFMNWKHRECQRVDLNIKIDVKFSC